MSAFVGEIVGTMLLVLMGDAAVANVVLNKSKAQGSGWIVIATGWGLAVAFAVYAVVGISGAHINPAVTIGLASVGQFPWAQVPIYILGQMIGGFIGAVLMWLTFYAHWGETDDPEGKLAIFCTGPAIRNYGANIITEIIATSVLVFGILAILSNEITAGLFPLLVGFLVWSLGLSMGGPTGYAMNPARDLPPRFAHFILPIPGKGISDWEYSWVPIVGPIIGGILGAVFFVTVIGG